MHDIEFAKVFASLYITNAHQNKTCCLCSWKLCL